MSVGEADYATIVQLKRLKATFYLKAKTLRNIRDGSVVTVLIGEEQSAKQAIVTMVSPVIEPKSGTRKVEVSIDNRDLELLSGDRVEWPLERNARVARRESEVLKEPNWEPEGLVP